MSRRACYIPPVNAAKTIALLSLLGTLRVR